MPIHDWSRVNAGIFHHFHQRWIGAICDLLNDGRLPSGYYALGEQIAGDIGPDVLALQHEGPDVRPPAANGRGLTAVADVPPKVSVVASIDMDQYALQQQTVVIRHSSGDRVVALIEVVSPGNKASQHGMRALLDKVVGALYHGYHLLLIDLHRPAQRDPQGLHGAIWQEIGDTSYRQPTDKPLTLVAYSAGVTKTAYVQPVAVGDALPDMPVFLQPGAYVNVALEPTYQTAWRSVPERWQRVL
jgi:hypothetical protein